MKTKHLLSFILFLPIFSFGQHIINDSLIASFYNKTLLYYFSDSITYNDQKKFGCILIKTEFDSKKLIKVIGPNNLKYFKDRTDEYRMLDRPYEINEGRSIYRIDHKIVDNYTIDVNIGGWTIEKASRHELNIAAWCGGTMGYIPDGRFIFDEIDGNWKFISSKEIISQKIIEEKSKMNKE